MHHLQSDTEKRSYNTQMIHPPWWFVNLPFLFTSRHQCLPPLCKDFVVKQREGTVIRYQLTSQQGGESLAVTFFLSMPEHFMVRTEFQSSIYSSQRTKMMVMSAFQMKWSRPYLTLTYFPHNRLFCQYDLTNDVQIDMLSFMLEATTSWLFNHKLSLESKLLMYTSSPV